MIRHALDHLAPLFRSLDTVVLDALTSPWFGFGVQLWSIWQQQGG